MTRSVGCGVIVLVLLALCIEVRHEFVQGEDEEHSSIDMGARGSAPTLLEKAAVKAVSIKSAAQNANFDQVPAAVSEVRPPSSEAIHLPASTLSTVDSPNNTKQGFSEPQTPPIDDKVTESSNAVIGRPIPMSASVEASCKDGVVKWGEIATCKILLRVSAMAQEPRDPVWAQHIEEKLRNIIFAEPGEFTIRTLECRQSLCVAEVASTYGPFPFIPRTGTSEPIHREIVARDVHNAYEIDNSGAKVTVSLWLFERR